MLKIPITRRKNASDYHDTLDPLADCGEIFKQLFLHEFPVEFLLAAELAQLRTFTFPNGTQLLHKTRQFEDDGVKRLDDTRAILTEMGRDTFMSPRGEMMAEHLNQIHGFYNIPNDEFLHTLSTFIFDVCFFINQYGWRPLTRNEELAIYHTYLQMGKMMHIQDIPETFDQFLAWRVAYEIEHQAFAETNRLVAEGLLRAAEQMVPAIMRPFLQDVSLSLAEKRLPALLGLQAPHPVFRATVQQAMRVRQWVNRHLTVWDTLDFEAMIIGNFKTYPHGFNPLSLGPTKLIAQMEKARARSAETTPINLSEQ